MRRRAISVWRVILAADFDRVIVAHGSVLPSGGREAMRAGFDWLAGAAARAA